MGTLRESMMGETTNGRGRSADEARLPAPLEGAAEALHPRRHPDRVVALKGTPISDEDGNDNGVHIKGKIASWSRGEVTATRTEGEDGGNLQLPGASIPVFDRSLGNPREREVFMALGA